MKNLKNFFALILIILGATILFGFYIQVQAVGVVEISAIVEIVPIVPPLLPPPPPPGVIVPPPVIETQVILIGRAHPLSSVTILKDGMVIDIVTADSLANFRKEIINIVPGIRTFGVWSEDTKGNRSLIYSFTTNIRAGMLTTISGIFLPPTISLDRIAVQRGETLNILGMTVPQSDITIFIDSPQQITRKTRAENDGIWLYALNTAPLNEGSHTARSKAIDPDGLQSPFSQSLAFVVGEEIPRVIDFCIRTDINRDRGVNLIDFSILLFWWGRFNLIADINQDRRVNLTDFSIMMYCWTG